MHCQDDGSIDVDYLFYDSGQCMGLLIKRFHWAERQYSDTTQTDKLSGLDMSQLLLNILLIWCERSPAGPLHLSEAGNGS